MNSLRSFVTRRTERNLRICHICMRKQKVLINQHSVIVCPSFEPFEFLLYNAVGHFIYYKLLSNVNNKIQIGQALMTTGF